MVYAGTGWEGRSRESKQQTLKPEKEDKERRNVKGRRFCVGEEFIHFLATLAISPRTILKKRMN